MLESWMVLLQRLLGIVVGAVLLVAAFVFASVILAIAAALAIVFGAWLWWKSRHVRRSMRERARASEPIEGEYRVERETRRIDRGEL